MKLNKMNILVSK